MALIIGEPGVGKSALLDELIEPVMRVRGLLARGKFDPGSDQPYSAVSAALASLAEQLLTEPAETLAGWRERLQAALGSLAPLACTLVPRLARVLDEREEPDEISELSPAEARNQVRVALTRLLTCFAQVEHPLVFALDDLQWADAGSLELIESVLREPHAAIFVVATARSRTRELADLLARAAAAGREVLELELGPLERPALTQLIADVLSRPPAELSSLAEIVARKTGSNPFFARQFLLHLADLGLLSRTSSGWSWDPAALEAASLPNDALEMMTAKLERLPEDLRELITIASVFGTEFDPLAVERVSSGTWAGAKFHRLVDEGLIAPVSGRGYVFGHDRIREAAYGLLGPARRRALHRAIGEDLLARLEQGAGAAALGRVFELVDHLNHGYGLLAADADADADASLASLEPERRRQLAALNVGAGQRALASGAPASALTYLEVGERLLASLAASEPVLAFEAALGSAQALALVGEHATADAKLAVLLERELEPEQRGRLAVARIWTLNLADRRDEAVEFGCGVLRGLGLALPERITTLDVLLALPRMRRLARPAVLERLCAREPITDARALAAISVLAALTNSTYVTHPLVFVLLTERHAVLLERHGAHPSAPLVFALLGVVLANALGRRREAVELARLGLSLQDHRSGRLLLTAQFAAQWTEPYATLLEPIREAVDLALEVGDVDSAGNASQLYIELSFYSGIHLRVVENHAAAWIGWARQWGIEDLSGGGLAVAAACRALVDGPAPDPELDDPLAIMTFAEFGLRESNSLAMRLLNGVALGLFGHWRAALALLEPLGDALERTVPGMCYTVIQSLFTGLAAATVAAEPGLEPRERRRLRRLLRRQRKVVARWVAKHGNFEHIVALFDAELAGLAGDLDRAAALFAKARSLAAAQNNPLLEALVCERTAATLLVRGQPRLAVGPLLDARDRYSRWGAFAKVAQLDEAWPELAAATGTGRSFDERTGSSSSSTTSRALDTATVLKTSQAIAEDIALADVVGRILALAVENAGAQRGALLLVDQGQLRLAAECDEQGTVVHLDDPTPLRELGDRLPAALLRWVERTAEPIILGDVGEDRRFASDPYLEAAGVRSALAAPIIKHGRLSGVLYLENRLSGGCFTDERLRVLELLTTQAASALDNARLYEDLRASEVRWRSLVEQLPDDVMLVDRSGAVEFVNRAPRSGEGAPDNPLDSLADESRHAVSEALARVFASGGQELLEVEGPGESGRAFAMRMAPIVIDQGIERVIVVTTDISERKQLEQRIRQQQRLESLGTLAAGVAHEINNPVQGIMNYAELIGGNEHASELIREFAGEIEHETNRVAALVRNLLQFSRQELHGSLEELDVKDVIEGTLSLLRAVLRKSHIKLELRIPADLPPLTCRPQQIQQVVMNLVANARDALDQRFHGFHEDKIVSVEVGSFERDARAWLRIDVSDRGGGVPEHVRAHIFDPFFTTKGRDRGTGLGLAVSHGIVHDHGGELTLLNRPGHGATFAIELPCTPV
jgi:PAS domain S-box-containing protein